VRAVATDLPEVLIVEPDVHRDARGFFVETYRADRYREIGIADRFVQDNYTRSVGGTIRGLHMQLGRPQAKLIRVVAGEIYDVAVDVRPSSPNFGRWTSVVLSASNFRQCYIPIGFAHGFCVLSESADVEYKCSDIYAPAEEVGVRWDDPAIGIAWPVASPILSARDRANATLAELRERLSLAFGPSLTNL
jgi:dTDP-4-dehydrorhamnose 3,5-epimerase